MSHQTDILRSKTARRKPLFLSTILGLIFLVAASVRAQDPLKLLPNNYHLIFENKDVAVIRAHYGPHEKIPVHDHTSYSTVFVYLNDSGPVRIDHAEAGEPPASITRPPTVKGSYRVAPGIKERHSIENLGDTSSDFLRVELKNVSLELKEPFRGKVPQSLSADLDTMEFTNPAVNIERIICTGDSLCAVKISPSPRSSLPSHLFQLPALALKRVKRLKWERSTGCQPLRVRTLLRFGAHPPTFSAFCFPLRLLRKASP